MRTTSLALLSILTLAGCAPEGKFIADDVPNSCGSTGYTFVVVHYGDSQLVVLPIAKVREGRELQYRLLPDRRPTDPTDYETSLVTITGVTPPDGSWMDAHGTYDDTHGVMTVCVPDEPGADVYTYKVDVDGVGELDPRAEVER
jgi:hypothetical protein